MNNAYGLTFDNLIRSVPEVLTNDSSTDALSRSIAAVLTSRPEEIDQVLIYPYIDRLPAELLDILAYDFNIGWWNADWDLEQKRKTFKASWKIRKQLGTKRAVEVAMESIFGFGTVQEWFEYGGEPYHYRITDADYQSVVENIRTFLDMLDIVARKSAVLDSITARSVREMALYIGVAMRKGAHYAFTASAVEETFTALSDEDGAILRDSDGTILLDGLEETA